MQEHPNVALARAAVDAMDRGDMEQLDTLFADDIVWHEIGRSEPLRGKEALRASRMGADYEVKPRRTTSSPAASMQWSW